MKIGELAQAAQCTPETVRYYEKAGLLPPPSRSDGNYRVYGPAHLERLVFVRHCRALDMTHEEIRELLELRDVPPSLDLAWLSPQEALSATLLEDMPGGHGVLLRQALAHLGYSI